MNTVDIDLVLNLYNILRSRYKYLDYDIFWTRH